MTRIAILASLLLLTACATDNAPKPITTVTVRVPVNVPCRPDIGAAPDYPDTDAAIKAAPDLFARVRLIVAGRLLRIQREAELNAAIKGCAG